MVELAELPQAARERIEQIRNADLVIALLAPVTQEEFDLKLADVHESIAGLDGNARIVVIHSGEHIASNPNEAIRTIPLPLLKPDLAADQARSILQTFNAVFAVSDGLGARATAVIVSDLHTVTPQWIHSLVRPVLELDFDLATPCYAHSKFEGLLNSSVIAPLTRALYGKRIQHPLGPDFGLSGRLLKRFLAQSAEASARLHPRSLASLSVDAVCDGFEICQAYVGPRQYPPADWVNQSSVLSQILGPVFQEAEHHAAYWQRIRGSQPVPVFGSATPADDKTELLDVRRMIESFQIGNRNLQEIWGTVLPPGTLLELGKLARSAPDQFRLPDRLWARIIFDFALGHRLRIISPDHLLRAMTPLYLAWVASFALEVGASEATAVADRFEQLSLAFEAAKPYALSRWRWPDRFNP